MKDQKIVNVKGWCSRLCGIALVAGALVASPFNAALAQLIPVPPSLTKTFTGSSVALNGTSTLAITLSNVNPTPANLVGPLIDTLPVGIVPVFPLLTSNTCGGTLTISPFGTSPAIITLTGGTIPAAIGAAPGQCVISVLVQGTSSSSLPNTLADGDLRTDLGDNEGAVCASLNVRPSVISLGKAFTDTVSGLTVGSVGALGTANVQLTLSNNGSAVATLTSPFVDTFATGTLGALVTNSCAGTITPVITPTTITLPVGSVIPANTSCVITVGITAPATGSILNALPAAALVTDVGSNDTGATATLNVVPAAGTALVIGKNFGTVTATTTAGVNSTLTITINNPAGAALVTALDLSDTLPAGVTPVPGSAATTCVTGTASISGQTVSVTGVTLLAAGTSCALTAIVSAPAAGNFINSAPTTVTVTGPTAPALDSAIATLNVLPASLPVSVGKSFSPATVTVNQPSTVTIVLNNPNSSAAVITSFIDNFPADIALSNAVASAGCGVGAAPVIIGSQLSLTGASITAGGTCTITLTARSAVANVFENFIPVGAFVTSLTGPNGSNLLPACATLNVLPAIVVSPPPPPPPPIPPSPIVSKFFSPDEICIFDSTSIVITLRNPATLPASIVSFADFLPRDLRVFRNSVSSTCGAQPVVFGRKLTLTGGAIPASGSCQISLRVKACAWGRYTNRIRVGSLQVTVGGVPRSNLFEAVARLKVIDSNAHDPSCEYDHRLVEIEEDQSEIDDDGDEFVPGEWAEDDREMSRP